jgi:tRNA pseudouridine38-40 synthase
MARFKLVFEYDGTRFAGWQVQKNSRTLQGEIFKAMERVFQSRDFEFYGSTRTDAGVHALSQVAHLDIKSTLQEAEINQRINDNLPHDVHLLSVEQVPAEFNARFDAQARSYVYLLSRRRTAFFKPYVWWIREELDMPAMHVAAETLCGFNNFAALSGTVDPLAESTSSLDLKFVDVYEQGELLIVHTVANHYMWNLVRRLVSTLVEVGRGTMEPESLTHWFSEPSGAVRKYIAPPTGLYLERVYYPGEEIMRGPQAFQVPLHILPSLAPVFEK